MARDALDAVDALGWPSFAIVGHSMSGSVMQRVLLDPGDRVSGLIGVNPVPSSGVPFDEQSWALFSGAGHHAMFETPVALLTSVERFLDRP